MRSQKKAIGIYSNGFLCAEHYSSRSERREIGRSLGENPKGILDLDGCFFQSFVVKPGMASRVRELGSVEKAEIQDIPYGISYEDLRALGKEGVLARSILAKQMDVRFSPFAASTFNDPLAAIRTQIMPSTSRPDSHLEIIGRESGVLSVENISGATEAGGKIRFLGETEFTHRATLDELAWLQKARALQQTFLVEASKVLIRHAFGHIAPQLAFQEKPYLGGINTDWAPTLLATGQEENSPLDHALRQAWVEVHEDLLRKSPKLANGKPSFHARFGPRNAEVQFTDVDKGIAASRLIALDQASNSPATGYILAGDDVARKSGYGTDAPAALIARLMSEQYGVPVVFVHVQHPTNSNLRGRTPEEAHSIQNLPREMRPHIAARVPTPYVLDRWMQEILRPQRERLRNLYGISAG